MKLTKKLSASLLGSALALGIGFSSVSAAPVEANEPELRAEPVEASISKTPAFTGSTGKVSKTLSWGGGGVIHMVLHTIMV